MDRKVSSPPMKTGVQVVFHHTSVELELSWALKTHR